MIISPSKHDNPDQTVVYASFLMLKILKEKEIVPYKDLLQYIKSNIQGGECLFIPALDFLFLLDLVEYQIKIDSFKCIGKRRK